MQLCVQEGQLREIRETCEVASETSVLEITNIAVRRGTEGHGEDIHLDKFVHASEIRNRAGEGVAIQLTKEV